MGKVHVIFDNPSYTSFAIVSIFSCAGSFDTFCHKKKLTYIPDYDVIKRKIKDINFVLFLNFY